MRLRISRAPLVPLAQLPDTTPNAFSFSPITSAGLSILYVSDAVIVSGIDTATTIDVFGGEYSINGGAYTAASGSVVLGDSVTVRGTSSSSGSITVTVTLNIGGVIGTFSITTTASSPTVGEMVGFFFPLTKAA